MLYTYFVIIFHLKLFEDLLAEYPNSADKLIPVPGDIIHQGMGISDKDVEMLMENVNVIIHSAATVRFDEPLR